MRIGALPLAFLAAVLFGQAWAAEEEDDREEDPEEEEAEAFEEEEEEDGDYENEVILTVEQLRALHGKLDENKDGKISWMELMDYAKHMHNDGAHETTSLTSDADTNKDGKISMEEHLALLQDSDGSPEMDEHRAYETSKFKAADVNNDGFLDNEEVKALFFPSMNKAVLEIETAENLKRKDTDGDGRLSEEEFWEVEDLEAEGPKKAERDEFHNLDKDADGHINVQELAEWESGLFHLEGAMVGLMNITDANKDGFITEDELAGAQSKLAHELDDDAAGDALHHVMNWIEHHEHLGPDASGDDHSDRSEL